jgi:SAM-dependent methyltransferase
MFLRRWDAPSVVQQYRLPRRGLAAEELLSLLEESAAPRAPDVVRYVLQAFRLLRNALPTRATLDAVKLLNGFLVLAEAVKEGELEVADARKARKFRDIIGMLSREDRALAHLDDLASGIAKQDVGALLDYFLEPEPLTGCRLDPYLLFRHAASQLYQEAHLQWERDPQGYLPGLAPVTGPLGRPARDVRYTPANLARALVQQALMALGDPLSRHEPLKVLDPACGSAIFHRECIRELAQRGVRTPVRLTGYDVSPIATYVAEFSLLRARSDGGPSLQNVEIDIRRRDALSGDWDGADLVLMNPPFVAWPRLTPVEQQAVRDCLGDLFSVRPDMATAFLLKAAETLKPGGVLASVLPAALLANKSTEPLRERLSHDADLLLVGRFEGYRYFPDSLVEPAFVVLRKKGVTASPARAVQVLIAEEGAEDTALRALRARERSEAQSPRVDLYAADPGDFRAQSWLPHRRSTYLLRDLLSRVELPKVGDLFSVRLGVRTGNKAAFVLSAEDWRGLPKPERRAFRPVAGQGTIHKGQLAPLYYLFYPYGTRDGCPQSEGDLANLAPTFYEKWLLPHKGTLAQRRRAKHWWQLAEKRTWAFPIQHKLVSTSFGSPGSFAYDSTREYVVVQGYAWLWKPAMAPYGSGDVQAHLHGTNLPWAYLALLNSSTFARLLACYCPRVQGGQFDLASRHVNQVPIPNLASFETTGSELVSELARIGRWIHAGRLGEASGELDHLSARVYGLPESL